MRRFTLLRQSRFLSEIESKGTVSWYRPTDLFHFHDTRRQTDVTSALLGKFYRFANQRWLNAILIEANYCNLGVRANKNRPKENILPSGCKTLACVKMCATLDLLTLAQLVGVHHKRSVENNHMKLFNVEPNTPEQGYVVRSQATDTVIYLVQAAPEATSNSQKLANTQTFLLPKLHCFHGL